MKAIVLLSVVLFLLSSCGTETNNPTSSSKGLSSLEFNVEDSLLVERMLVNEPTKTTEDKVQYLSSASKEELIGFVEGKTSNLLEGLDMENDIHIQVFEDRFIIYPTCPYQVRGAEVEIWRDTSAEAPQYEIVSYSKSIAIYLNIDALEKAYALSKNRKRVSKERFIWRVLLSLIKHRERADLF